MKAFPQSNDTVINTMLNRDNKANPEGMDLRDYFACHAMINAPYNKHEFQEIAEYSYKMADAMMEARDEA